MIIGSFRARLLILLLLGVLPSLGLVLYMNFEQRRLEKMHVQEAAVATSELSAANQQNFFQHTRQLLGTLTQFSFLTLATDREFVREHLSNLRKLSPDYSNFGLIETNGMLFSSADPLTNSVNLGDRPYFQRVLQTKKFCVGDFQVGRVTGQPGLNFGFPVLDDEGTLKRVLYASLRISLLSEVLGRVPLPRESSITVLDRSGTVLARSPQAEMWVGKKSQDSGALRRILSGGKEVFEMAGPDGIERLHAVTPVYDSESAGLFVVVDTPVSVCYERANRNLARNLAFVGVLATIILSVGHYYSRHSFLVAVNRLGQAAGELANGNLTARVGAISGSAEWAQLGRAFDEMASRLQRRQAEIDKANDEIRKMNEQLEQRVKDRTAELEAANHELEAFSYSVSHDLRAPLRHVSGFVDLLQRKGESLDADARRFVEFIGLATKQMNQLVEDLLSFSRMSRAEMRLASVNLSDLVAQVRKGFDGEVNGRAVEWSIHSLPEVKGDAALLRVALTNLLGNAVKYTRPRNPARIEIGSTLDGAQHVIYVRDNGVGFDMKYASKLFGVFQRFHHAEDFEGTGIGLATVQRIILRMGGRIWADAKENEGATFYFSLPKTG